MPPDRPEGIWGELERLRNWRHDVAMPELASLRGRLQSLEGRMADIEPQVERMAKADDIADAVTEHIQASRRGLLSTGEKLGGLAVGVAAVASVIVQLLGH